MKWGLSFVINPEPLPTGRAAGGLGWAGLANSYYWIDPARKVTGVFATQNPAVLRRESGAGADRVRDGGVCRRGRITLRPASASRPARPARRTAASRSACARSAPAPSPRAARGTARRAPPPARRGGSAAPVDRGDRAGAQRGEGLGPVGREVAGDPVVEPVAHRLAFLHAEGDLAQPVVDRHRQRRAPRRRSPPSRARATAARRRCVAMPRSRSNARRRVRLREAGRRSAGCRRCPATAPARSSRSRRGAGTRTRRRGKPGSAASLRPQPFLLAAPPAPPGAPSCARNARRRSAAASTFSARRPELARRTAPRRRSRIVPAT